MRLADMRSREGYNALNQEQQILLMEMFQKQIQRELNLDSSRDHFLDEETFKIVENAKEQKQLEGHYDELSWL